VYSGLYIGHGKTAASQFLLTYWVFSLVYRGILTSSLWVWCLFLSRLVLWYLTKICCLVTVRDIFGEIFVREYSCFSYH